ncbi:membrane cofactor protein-like [Pteronotus mesoamericanus]|uniref:membrane cofactor protein-like n=1 Tax=Pteronotus mesoamericanus TaxID=1884717 RepID=UPI0023EAC881|nr:membrane cofactor protein-like [Pteronotus parnellii mesoamericanus]
MLYFHVVLLLCSDACGAPPRFESMRLKGHPKITYRNGDNVEYQCRPGYMRSVPLLPVSSVCQPDGIWTPLQEACKRKSCPQLGEPVNGEVNYINGTFQFGSQAHYVCNEGYYLLGTKILYCKLSGKRVEWSDSPPQCEKILCQPPRQISNGRYTNSHKDTFEYNEVVIYRCNPSAGPDEYSLVGESRLVCSGHNQWSSEPPKCKVVKCQYPVLKNGRLVSGFGKRFYYKATVVLECLEGFYLEGSATIVCGAKSTWEPKMPKCIKESTRLSAQPTVFRVSDSCDAPPRFESMMLKGHPKITYRNGDNVEYQCRPGYMRSVPLLPVSSVCQPDGTWKPLQEACKRKSCPQLAEPVNGEVIYVNGTFQFGSQAHYFCNEGYYLLGTKILYCELSGKRVEWSDSPPQCEKILCQPPRQISNGRYTNSHKDTFEYNEVVIYRCNPSAGPDDYSLVGESRLVCSGHNQWSSEPPECKVVKCQYPVLKNGRLVSGFGKRFYYKATVVLECLEGFYLEGSATIVCGAKSTWEPKMPKCIKGAKIETVSLQKFLLSSVRTHPTNYSH